MAARGNDARVSRATAVCLAVVVLLAISCGFVPGARADTSARSRLDLLTLPRVEYSPISDLTESGGVVVFAREDNGLKLQVHRWLGRDASQPLSPNSLHQCGVEMDGSIAVWAEGAYSGPYSLRVHDLDAGTTSTVRDSAELPSRPDVSGDWIVWQENDPETYSNIYAYNIVTRELVPVCLAPGSQTAPRIAGDVIVWHDKRRDGSGSYEDIYGYRLSTRQEFLVHESEGFIEYIVTDGSTVAWAKLGYGIYVRACDLATGVTRTIASCSHGPSGLQVSGDYVAWTDDYRVGDVNYYAVMACKLSGGDPFVVADVVGSTWRLYEFDGRDLYIGAGGRFWRATMMPVVGSVSVSPGQIRDGYVGDRVVTLDLVAWSDAGAIVQMDVGEGLRPYAPTIAIGPLDDGPHSLRATFTDAAGNSSLIARTVFFVDTKPPSSQCWVDSWDGTMVGEWSTGDVQIWWDVHDESQTGTLHYRLDGGPWQTADTMSLSIPRGTLRDGIHTVEYYAADAAGNTEAAHVTRFGVDSRAPTLAGPSGLVWSRVPVSVQGEAADASGVAPSLEYRIDGRPWTRSAVAVVPAPADHSGDGVHQVEYRATDHVGRVSRSRCTWVGIDTQPPTVVIANDVVARRGRTALLSFTPDDLLSASARCSVTIARRGKTVLRLRNATCPTGRKRSLKYLCDLKPGVYTWSVSAVDAAGNVAPKAAAAKLTVRR